MSVIVSAYFKIPSKKSHAFYLPHLNRFMRSIQNHVVFFTTPDLIDMFKVMRGTLPMTIVPINSIYDIVAFKKYGYEFWKSQCEIDSEKYHTPELAAVWYNKKEFVKQAIEITLHMSHFPYIWCDAGCVRDDRWQIISIIKTFGNRVSVIPKDKLLLQTLCDRPTKIFFTDPDRFVAGAIIAGYRDTWNKCSDLYDATLAKYVEEKICCNSDQYVWATASLVYREHFECVKCDYPDPVEDWFRFLSYLSTWYRM